jgi:hypothetical protein
MDHQVTETKSQYILGKGLPAVLQGVNKGLL